MSEREPQQDLLEQLIASISRLARPAESQIAYLDALGPATPVDELALEFDDVAPAARAAAQLLSPRQRRLVGILDDQLASMSDQPEPELWSRAGLQTAPAWALVRERARATLAAFHAEPLARR